MENRPNIIFFLADDLGWGDLGCYGHDVSNYDLIPPKSISVQTPHLDALAAEGKLFTQYYVNGPMCSPARAGIMTGRHPSRLGIHFWMNRNHNKAFGMPDWLDPAIPTLPRLLQAAGYKTAHFGKWHIGDGPGAPEVTEYGFNECRILCQGNGPSFGIRANHPEATSMIIDETIRFLRENRDSPIYINAWPLDVHAPLDPTEEALQRYEHLMSGKRRTAMQIYFAVITEMDRQIGRLVRGVDEMGLAEDTIIIFSSDNGPEDIYIPHAGYHAVGLPGPFRGRKRSLYEGGIREPFILRWKRHAPGRHVDDTTVLNATDLLPTFCSLAGVPLPLGFETDGEDMSEAFRGGEVKRQKPLMWEWRFHGVGQFMNRSPMLAIRDGDWKLLLNPDRSRLELYDMVRQPYELHSVGDKHPDIVERMAEEVLSWQRTLPPGSTIEKPGQDTYRWPQEIRITEEDILHD